MTREDRGAAPTTVPPAYYERSAVYAYGHTVTLLVLFVGLVAAARIVESVSGLVLVFLLIGLAQYRLYFVLHDCSHMTLFRHRAEHLVVGHLVAGILLTAFDSFRAEHMKHHKVYGTTEDPGGVDYWVRFRSRGEMVRFLAAPLWGGGLLAKLRANYGFAVGAENGGGAGGIPRKWPLAVPFLVQAGLCLFVSRGLAEPWRYPVLVVLPAATVFLFLSRLRMFLEHGSLDYEQFDYLTAPRVTARTIPSRIPERVIFCGMNFNFHYEHHLFPAVPSCRLKRLHEEVTRSSIQPEDFAPTYLAALAGLWRKLGGRPIAVEVG